MMKRVFRRWTTRQSSVLKSNTATDDPAYYDDHNNHARSQEYHDSRSIAGYTLKTEEQFDLEIPTRAIQRTNNNSNLTNLLKIKLIPHVIVPSPSNEANDSNVSDVTWDSDVKYRHRRRRKKTPQQRPATPLHKEELDKEEPSSSSSSTPKKSSWLPSNLCQSACCGSDGALLETIEEDDRSLTTSKNKKKATATTPTKSKFMSCVPSCHGWSTSPKKGTPSTPTPRSNNSKGFLNCYSCGSGAGQPQEEKRLAALRAQKRAFLGSDSRTQRTGYYATARSMDKSLFDDITMRETSTDEDDDDPGATTTTPSRPANNSVTVNNNYIQQERMQKLKLSRPPGKQFRRRLRQQSKEEY